MAKKANFRSNFGLFLQNLISKIFFCGFYLYQMLYIVISYHCMQFQGKLVKQSWENHKKMLVPSSTWWIFVDFTYTTCKTLMKAITVCNFKEN